jgi:uncharacterized Zn finger protein
MAFVQEWGALLRKRGTKRRRERTRTMSRHGGVAKLPYAGLNRIRFEGTVSTGAALVTKPTGTPASGGI